MPKPKICIVVAMTVNGHVIGNKGKIPWRLKTDMVHFKDITMGHPVIMGRKTFFSIPKKTRPLPGRPNIVLSANPETRYVLPKNVMWVENLDSAIKLGKTLDNEKVFVIGGEGVYTETLPDADYLYVTRILQSFEGDTCFPKIPREFKEKYVSKINKEKGIKFQFVEYERV